MRVSRPVLLSVAAVATLAACAPAGPVTGPLPVKGVPTQAWRGEIGDPDHPSSVVYVRNDTDRPIILTDFQIYSCVNVRQDCTTYTRNAQIDPGQTVIAMQVDRIQPSRIPSFGYSYRTRGQPISTVNGNSRVTLSTGTRPAGQLLVDVEQFKAVVGPVDRDGQCARMSATGPVPGSSGQSMTMIFGTPPRPYRMVNVQLDSTGAPTLYRDTRGDLVSGTPANPLAPPAGLRTTIQIAVAEMVGHVTNEGSGMPVEDYTVTGPAIMTAASLSVPATMMQRVIRECGRS